MLTYLKQADFFYTSASDKHHLCCLPGTPKIVQLLLMKIVNPGKTLLRHPRTSQTRQLGIYS